MALPAITPPVAASRPLPVVDDAPMLPKPEPGLALPKFDASVTSGAPNAPGMPDAQGSRGWKLWNETNVTPAIVQSIDGAKSVVNAEFFGISDGGKGHDVVDALVRAADRGVEVNVMADEVSMVALPVGSFQRMQKRIEAAGGDVRTNFRVPLVGQRAKETPGLAHVDHRKVVTVDGTDAFVGGINFIKLEDDYHDSMVQLKGIDAARLAADQLDRWGRVGGAVSARHTASVADALGGVSALAKPAPEEMQVLKNAPDQGIQELTTGYRDLIRNAKQRVWISTPGLSDQGLIEDINQAAARGVDVRIVSPGKPPLGIPVISWVGRSHLKELLGHGGTAYEIPEVLHRKALIADDEVIFSSYNVTGRSREHDHEIGVRTADPEFVAAIGATLQKDMSTGTKLEASALNGVGVKIGDFLAQKLKIDY
ncbi:MAG: cls [Thermoleophilia bacterium]|nr:cls [Thermoleophilia bacterium]